MGSLLWLSPRPALADDLDAAYLPGILAPRDIKAVAVQPDGKIIFSTIERRIDNRRGLVRLNVDGTLDPSFNPQTDLHPYAIALLPDGKILIGGEFTINGATKYFVRLNSDGTLDTSFANGLPGPDGFVERIALQPDGKILIGGYFSKVNGVTRVGIARLNADGTLDTGFGNGQAGVENSVSFVLALQPDGRILIGGHFTSVNGVPRDHLARLNSDGTLDTGFLAGVTQPGGSHVECIVVQSDGKILIGGMFSAVNGTAREGVARLNANGTLDTSFASVTLNNSLFTVTAIALQTDGKPIIGGNFTLVNGTTRNHLARLNTNGSLDTTYHNGQEGILGPEVNVPALNLQPNGKLIVGGGFARINGVERHSLARLNADGTPDATFSAEQVDETGEVTDMVLQPDGKSIIAGNYITSVNGVIRHQIARLNADGSLDTTFSDEAAIMSGLTDIALQPDGKIVVGGSFRNINGLTRNLIARLNSDGTLDMSFADGLAGASNIITVVNDIALQPDGKILIGGGDIIDDNEKRIARLNSDGTLDVSFANGLAGTNQVVQAIAVQPDGKILIGGFFAIVHGTARNRIARLNSNGTLDTTFLNGQAGASGGFNAVNVIALQPDGKILIGGGFNRVNGATRKGVARLNPDGSLDTSFGNVDLSPGPVVLRIHALILQPDGKIVVGGTHDAVMRNLSQTIGREGLARLNTDGTLDTTCLDELTVTGTAFQVRALAMQADGKVLFGGSIYYYNGVERFAMARLSPTLCIDDTSVSEGNSGQINTTFTVSVSGFTTQSGTVNFATAGGTATQGTDHIANSGSLFFNPGDMTKTITVSVSGDTLFEPDETFFVSLTNPVNFNLARAQGTGTIRNDDSMPPPATLQFSQPNYTVSESAGFVNVTVTRSGDTSTAVAVDFTTSDNSDVIPDEAQAVALCGAVNSIALSKCDFNTAVGTLRFASGETSKSFTVLLTQDSYIEGTERAPLTLSNPTNGASLGSQGTAMLEITDDPGEPSTNAIDDARNFVRQHYHDFLNREPDQAGWDFWTDNIVKCNDPARRPAGQTIEQCIDKQRETTSGAFFLSPEFQYTGSYIYGVYRGSLDQRPTFLEFMRDLPQLGNGIIVAGAISGPVIEANRTQYLTEFVQRTAFLNIYGALNNQAYVDKLFQTTGTSVSNADRQALVNGLDSGTETRATVLHKVVNGTRVISEGQVDVIAVYGKTFFDSQFNPSFVQMEYFGYMRRNEDTGGFNHWLGKMIFFGDFIKAEMVRAFLLSPEYRRRFGSN